MNQYPIFTENYPHEKYVVLYPVSEGTAQVLIHKMADPPRLPEKVSIDGREIWDWAGKMAEHMNRQAKMSELRTQLSQVGTVCGDCCKWMHSNSCPRETNVNGRRRGPSMNAPICNQYVEKQSSSEWRVELQKRLYALTEKLSV